MFQRSARQALNISGALIALTQFNLLVAAASDWPMLGHDAARSGTTANEIRPPFERKWFRLFTDEGLMAGIQPVVGDGKLFVGTLHGTFQAISADSGKDVWKFQCGGAVLHTCAMANGKVLFGCADGKVYALNSFDGKLAWTFQTGAAIWNAPAIHEGTVLIGSRDSRLYALDVASGTLRWTAHTGGPLLNSPAIDANRGAVYIGGEDMRVYAFDLRDGQQRWHSEKLPGVSLRGYHPVIAPDGAVLVTVQSALSLDRIAPVLLDMVKEVFGDFASWRHKKDENEKLRAANFELLKKPEIYEAQLNYLRKRLAAEPALQTFFVLDSASGKQKFVAPIVYSESMNGPGAPPIVTANGKVIVKFQALLRSRYEHYSPFLNVGYLNTTNGHVTPLMDQSRTYGWHDSLLLVHDEQSQLVAGGRVLINTHQDNVNALDLDTLKGYSEPFAQNVHEPQAGEAVAIWTRLARGETLPQGKEWLARGTAIYGGGSVLDVPITIAGDSFYYLPTHEINCGSAIIAYGMKAGGTSSRKSPVPSEKPAPEEWKRMQLLPWDWDTLGMGRLDHVLKALPGKIPGTKQQPLTNEAARAVAKITDAELDELIWREPAKATATASSAVERLQLQLANSVRELISTNWRPLLFPAGKHAEHAYRFFNEPTETLYTLALSYSHLGNELQKQVKGHVAQMMKPGGALGGSVGDRFYNPTNGAVRSAYDHPPEKLMRISENFTRDELARVYPFWLWARVSDDWSAVESRRKDFEKLLAAAPNKIEEDCRNGRVAGLIALCRLAKRFNDEAALARALPVTRQAMRDRIAYELAFTRGGLIYQVPTLRSIFSRWEHLTPEVAALCAKYAGDIQRDLMRVYVDHHRPTWWLAWNVETMMRNECPMEFPTMSAGVFAARALIVDEPAETLARFIDLPWCKGDEYYIQKLALALSAGSGL